MEKLRWEGDVRWRSSLGLSARSTYHKQNKPLTASSLTTKREKLASPCSKRFAERLELIQSRRGRRTATLQASKPIYAIKSFGNAGNLFEITTQRKAIPRLSAKAVTQSKLDFVLTSERRHREEAVQAAKPLERRRFDPANYIAASVETSEIRVATNESTDPRVYILKAMPRMSTMRVRHRSDVGEKCAAYCMD